MNGDLVSLRILAVCGSEPERDMLRYGAGTVTIPLDVIEADSAKAAKRILARDQVDIVFLDSTISTGELTSIAAAAHAQTPPAFVIFMVASPDKAEQATGAGIDAVVAKPTTQHAAHAMLERCIRVRLPNRVLLVDDSLTMRSIVRKILSASRFKFDIAEANEGVEALKQIGSGRFDLVILDYNMPGFNGIETLAAIKRQHPQLCVVIMTSTLDEAIADKARDAGAAAFLKKPFYPSDIDTVLYSVFGLWTPAR